MFKQLLAKFKITVVDERKQSKDRSFINLTISLEKLLNRSLTGAELIAVWDIEEHQSNALTELLTAILKESEANKG